MLAAEASHEQCGPRLVIPLGRGASSLPSSHFGPQRIFVVWCFGSTRWTCASRSCWGAQGCAPDRAPWPRSSGFRAGAGAPHLAAGVSPCCLRSQTDKTWVIAQQSLCDTSCCPLPTISPVKQLSGIAPSGSPKLQRHQGLRPDYALGAHVPGPPPWPRTDTQHCLRVVGGGGLRPSSLSKG